MKPILKFLLIAALFMVNMQLAAAPVDGVTQTVAAVASVAIASGLVLPARYVNMGQLHDVTAMPVFQSYIVEKLRQSVEFLTRSRDVSKKVLGGAIVYIPQAGASPQVIKNNNSWPMVAVRRTDGDVFYPLDAYSTAPTHVPWQDLQAISYPKLDSVIGGHMGELVETVADDILIKWAPTVAGMQVATTGGAVGPVGAQTGNRKGLVSKDLAKAMNVLNVQRVPKKGRVAMIDDNMYEFLYNDLSDTQANAFNQFADNKTGQVGRLHGFDIYTRSAVAYANGSATPKPFGSALAATDNLACLCWHEDMVERAIGDTKLFADKDDPLYQGDLYSGIVRAGGRKIRGDEKGVIAIVQAPSA